MSTWGVSLSFISFPPSNLSFKGWPYAVSIRFVWHSYIHRGGVWDILHDRVQGGPIKPRSSTVRPLNCFSGAAGGCSRIQGQFSSSCLRAAEQHWFTSCTAIEILSEDVTFQGIIFSRRWVVTMKNKMKAISMRNVGTHCPLALVCVCVLGKVWRGLKKIHFSLHSIHRSIHLNVTTTLQRTQWHL